jgi:PKD domain containing protein
MLSVVQKGTTVYYKVTVKNNNTQRYSGGTLRVKLPDPTVTNWELPAVTDPTIIVSDFGNVAPLGNINISYDTGDASVLILSGLDGGVLTHNSERSVYIPIKVKEGSCSGYENACLGVLTGKGEFLYEINQTQGGNTCRASGKVESAARGVAIDNSDCDREELVCAGTGNSVTLNARGTGYTSYQWYNGGSDGSSYAVIGGETGASYTATSAGFYKVEKTTTCSGATVTRSEVIEVVSSGASTSTDPISRAAGGQGGVCDSGQGPSWVSHFYLCDGNQRTLNVTFYEATQVLWQQERSGCAPTSANCLSTTDSCWTTVQSGRSFTISNAGRYRLKVERGGCSKEYYFEVFTSGLSGDMGTPVPHTDLSQGAVTVTMNTRNTQYMYTVTRVSDGALIHNGTLGPVPNGSTEFGNILNITGLVVPGSRTSDQFRIKITSSPASRFNGCKWEETVTIPYQRGMNSTVEFPNVWATNDCNKTRFDFTVTGGANPYKVLLYKIDGAYYKRSHQNVLYENIPDGDFETGITMTSTTVPHKFELWTEVPREGKYIFLIKDRDGRYAETNEVLVNQSSRYAVEITTGGNPLLCATQAGATISARFLDTTVPSPQIVLKKYKADGSLDTSFGTHTNASGQFPTTGGQPLGAGKYRIEMSYQFSHGGGTRCTIVREVEITSPEPIRASIGVVSDKNCSVDTPKQHKLKVNWVTGGVPPYQYSTGGVYSNDPELKISGATQANPKVTVYVKDSKGCIAEFEVIAANAIEEPRTLAANQVQVTYDCAGNGSFTITPTTPSGRTYVYEYGLDNQTRQSPNGGDGVSMSYTGLAGRSTPYQVKIYYKDTAATPINELYKDTFGTGDVVSCLVGSGAPTVIGCADVTGSLTPGAHLVTEQLAGGSSTYRSIAGTGRYYAVHSAIGSNRRIFEKTISNVVPARKVSVSLRYINLALASSGLSSNVGLKVSLEVENPSGGGATLFSKTLPAASLTDNWKDGELDFPELAGFNTNKTQVNLIIETTTGNAVVGLDDIRVTQPSEDCQTPKTIPVVVAPNRGFGSTLGNIEAPKCQGESGKAHVTLRNAEATATYEYRIDSGSYQSTTLLTGDRLELAVPIGTHRIFVKMIKSVTESCEIEVGEVTVVDIPKVAINSIEILPQGCVAPHLTAGATLKVQFGRAPYEVYFQESGAAAWTQATSASPYDLVWTQSNTTATFRGLDAGKSYLFKVKDANGCESLTVSQVVPTKIDLTADVLETRCLSVGATGTITVDVNTGNGDYEFRIQKTLPTPVAWTAWAPGNQGTASQEFDGLQPGTYQIEVRDRLGCTLATSPVTVTIGDVLEFAHESDNGYDCKSPVTPENITFTMKGGVEFASGDKYRIEWKRGGTATDPTGYNPRTDTDGNNVNLTGLTAIAGGYELEASIKTPGTYHFKLTDSKGCVRTVTEEVEAVTPAFLSSSPLVSNVIGCAGEAEGIIGISDGLNGYLPIENAIDRTRGVPPYRIEIYKYNDATYTTGETLLPSSTGRDLLAGYYKVRLKDAKECYTDQFIHVDEVTRPNATATKVQDINCAVGGQRNLGKINVTFSGAPSANYYVGLYTDNSYTMLAISGATTPAVTGELFTGVTTVNKTFEDLLEGDYYPAVINRTTGCMTPLKDGSGNPLKLTITGTTIEVTNGITTGTNDCEKYEIQFKVKDRGGIIDETKLEIAFYTGAVPSATSPLWQSFTPGNTIGTGNNKQALYTRTLLRGIRYQVAVRYNSCVSIHTFEPLDIPVGNPTITQRRLPAICGTQVNFEYDVTNITTATSIDWDVYDYPMDPTAPTTASSKLSGTATVTGGKAKITGTTSSLNLIRGNQYILVVRASGASPQCAFGYKVFTITESDAPLAIVRADLVKNYNCVGSAQVSVEVKDGTGPYWYTISDVNANPSTDEWADANVIGGTRGTPSRTAVIDKTFITTYANKIEGSVTGTTWYVHVRDAKNCWASTPITIKNDQEPNIASAEIENPCATGEYTLLVKMNKVGSGAVHYYTFTPAGGTESSRQPIQFVQVSTSPELWEGRINRVYPSTATRTLKIYDQNGCEASNTTTFEYKGRVTFNVNQTRLLSCLTTPAGAGNAVLKVSEISNLVTGYNYRYRLVRVEVGQDPITGAETTTDIPVTDGAIPSTTTTSLPDFDMITRAGRYRVDIWETTHPCPFSVTVTVRDKVEPVIALQDTDNSKCYNATPSLGASEGGTAVLYASPESIAPMTYSIIGARYASDNSAVSFTGGIPATYTNVSASNAFVTIADNGRKVTFEKLYGHINGVIYTVKAVAANGCEATTEFTIYGVKPILIDIDQARVVQFACNGDQEVMAKLSVPSGAITGGSGNYLFTLLKGGAVVTGAENVVEPSFTITDETGGSYSLRVTDARYECASVEIPFTITTGLTNLPTPDNGTTAAGTAAVANRDIDPFVKVTDIDVTEALDITCTAGESVKVDVTLSPATVATDVTIRLKNVIGGSFDHTMSITGTGSHTFTGVGMGNYSVEVLNVKTGCVVYGPSYRVQDPNTFAIAATDDKPVKCYGGNDGEITLTFIDTDLDNQDQASGGFTYTITSITNPTMTPLQATVTGNTVTLNTLPFGTYNVSAKSTITGCQTKIPTIFSIRQADQPIYIESKVEVPDKCTGTGSAEISVVVTGGIAPYKLTIVGSNGYTQTANSVYHRWVFTGLPGAPAPTGATYTFTIEDAWGCTAPHTNSTQVITTPDPINFASVDITPVSCQNAEDGTLTVTGTTGGSPDDPSLPLADQVTTYYYELYSAGLGSIRPLQKSNEFKDLPAGNYTLTVSDRWGCVKDQSVTIGTPTPITVSFVGSQSLLCYDTTGSVQVTATGGTHSGTPTYNFELVDQSTGTVVKTEENISTLPHTIYGLKANVVYVVRATDEKGCSGTSTTLVLSTAPNLNVKASYEDECTNNEYTGNVVITFDDTTVDFSKVRYSFDGGTTKHTFTTFAGAQARINRSHSSVRPSSLPQTINLYYTDGGSNCAGETTPVVIPVVVSLSVIKDPSYAGALNELKVLGKNGVPEYTYYFNGVYYGDTSLYVVRKTDPEDTDPSDGKLKKRIDVKVIDSKGCEVEETYYMEFVEIEIPNYFTPNGDGENDTWTPMNIRQYPNIHTMIYDRYGRLIKELYQGDSWDGTYNGKDLPSGDYWYIITLGSEDDSREFKGHFTLFR